ncbi:MAG: capsid protein [Wigfec virus K19_467]|nr:MAG: capsid protein [Wigfec virus K19_467]
MPRRKRRRWVKSLKRFNALLNTQLGTKTVVNHDAFTHSGTVATEPQSFLAFMLYGSYGDDDTSTDLCGARDLQKIFANDTEVGTTTAAKVRFESGVLDLILRNANVAVEEQDEALPQHVSIYEVIFRKITDRADPHDDLTDAQDATGKINSTPDKLSIHQNGVTFFDLPAFISLTGMRILKKTDYLLPAGEFITYQIRDPRNYEFMTSDVFENEFKYIKPRMTKGLMVVYRNSPGGLLTQNMMWQCTRKYSYKKLQNKFTADNYIN